MGYPRIVVKAHIVGMAPAHAISPHSYENMLLARIAIELGIGARTSLFLAP
jgi:hypothetical protein